MLKNLYICILILIFFSTNSVIDISTFCRNILTILLVCVTGIMLIKKFLNKEERKKLIQENKSKVLVLFIFIILYLIMLVYSIISISCNGLKMLIMENYITIGMIIISLVLAFNTSFVFGKKNLYYILLAGIINYLLVVLSFVFRNGIDGLMNFQYLNENFIDTSLEVHELTFILGLIFTYLIINSEKWGKNKIIAIAILSIFLYLGYKRIITGALIVVLSMYFIGHFIKNKKMLLNILSIFTFVIVIGYFLTSTVALEGMQALFAKLGIDMMGRNDIYIFLKEKYEISFGFWGNGIRSTEHFLQIVPQMRVYSAIHNDILRIYIENGIYMSLIYFCIFIFVVPYLLNRKCNASVALQYMYIVLYTFICYTTDNLFTYYRYIFVMFAIIFLIIDKNQKNIKKRKINKEVSEEKHKVSVILPVYNSEDTIEKTIRSVLAQTYKNIEIIVINDGSTDETEKICKSLEEKNHNIRYFKIENSGVSTARNIAIQKATGEYIAFIDSDDEYHENFIKYMLNDMLDNKVDFITCGYTTFGANTDIYTFSEDKVFDIIDERYILELQRIPAFNQIWNKLYNTEVLRRNNILFRKDIDLGEDFIFNLDYIRNINKTMYICDLLYNYKVTGNGLNNKYRENRFNIEYQLLKELEKCFKDQKYNMQPLYEQYVKIYFYGIVNIFNKNNRISIKEKNEELKKFILNEKYRKELEDVDSKIINKKYKIIIRILEKNDFRLKILISIYILKKMLKCF